MKTLLATFILLLPTQAPKDSGRDLARSVAGIFDDNRSKFPFGEFRIECVSGEASSLKEARADRYLKSHRTMGEYVFIPDHARYRRAFSNRDMEEETRRPSATQSTSTLVSVQALHNSKLSLIDRQAASLKGSEPDHLVAIVAGVAEFNRFAFVPLALGLRDSVRGDLARDVKLALDGRDGWSLEAVEDRATFEGREVVKVVLKVGDARRIYWVDPERGGVPLMMRDEMAGGKQVTELVQEDLRQVKGRGWLPFAMTMFHDDGRVQRVLIRSEACENPLSASVLGLDFPVPVAAQDQVTNRVYAPQKYWHLDELSGPNSPKATPVARPDLGPPVLPGERESPSWRIPIFTISLAAVVALAGGLLWMRSRM